MEIEKLTSDYIKITQLQSELVRLDCFNNELGFSQFMLESTLELEVNFSNILSELAIKLCNIVNHRDDKEISFLKNKFNQTHDLNYLYLISFIENNSKIDDHNLRLYVANEILKIKESSVLMNKGLYNAFDTLIRFNPEILEKIDSRRLLDFFFLTPEDDEWSQRLFYHLALYKFLIKMHPIELEERLRNSDDKELKSLLSSYPNHPGVKPFWDGNANRPL